MRRSGAVLAIICILRISDAFADAPTCPDGQVWGGTRCEHKELCRDGTPAIDGKCGGSRPADKSGVKPPAITTHPTLVVTQSDSATTGKAPCIPMSVRARGQCHTASSGTCSGEATFFYSPPNKKAVRARRVLLAGGNAGDLIEQYFSDAAKEAIVIDPERLMVFYYDGTVTTPNVKRGDVDVDMSFLDFIFRTSMEARWSKDLRPVNVPPLPCGFDTAQCLNADFICNRHP